MMRRLTFTLVLVAGCGVFDDAPDVTVRIEDGDRMPPAMIVFEIRNNLDTPIDLPQCGDRLSFELETLRQGQWENAAAAVCEATMLSVPRTLAPGASTRDSMSITSTGQFRFRVHYTVGPDARHATSASFAVTYPPD